MNVCRILSALGATAVAFGWIAFVASKSVATCGYYANAPDFCPFGPGMDIGTDIASAWWALVILGIAPPILVLAISFGAWFLGRRPKTDRSPT